MSTARKEYAVVGFQWELLALVVNAWTKEAFGVDVRERLGNDHLRAVLDDDFCRTVATTFRRHWITPEVIDFDRQERVARALAAIDELVEDLFAESEDLREQFKSRCRDAGLDLDDLANGQPVAPQRRAVG